MSARKARPSSKSRCMSCGGVVPTLALVTVPKLRFHGCRVKVCRVCVIEALAAQAAEAKKEV